MDIDALTPEKAAIKDACKVAGGPSALGRMLGITHTAIFQWDRVPAERVLTIERLTGVSRTRLRPDIYPAEDYPPLPSENQS